MLTSINYQSLDTEIIHDLNITDIQYYYNLNRKQRNILRRYYYATLDLSFIKWYNISDNSLTTDIVPDYITSSESLFDYDLDKELRIIEEEDISGFIRNINIDSSKNLFICEHIKLVSNKLIGIRADENDNTRQYKKRSFFSNRDYSGNSVSYNINNQITDISNSLINAIIGNQNGSRYITDYDIDISLCNSFIHEISNNLIDDDSFFTIISLQNKKNNISSFEIVFDDYNNLNNKYLDPNNQNNKWCLYKDLGKVKNDVSFVLNGDKEDISFTLINENSIQSDSSNAIIMYRDAINDWYRWSGYYTNLNVGLPNLSSDDGLSNDITIPVTFIPNNDMLMRDNSNNIFGIKDISYNDRNILYNIDDNQYKIDNKNSCFYKIADASNLYHNILVLAGKAEIKRIQNVFDNSYNRIDEIDFKNLSIY